MPIRKTSKQPDFTRLYSVLAQSKDTDNPTYQVLSELIDKIRQMQTNLGQGVQAVQDTVQNNGGFSPSTGGGSTTPSAHHTTHETGGSDAITSLDGGVITSGIVADARLSTNVALVNQDNNFTISQSIRSNNPAIQFFETDQPADNKRAFMSEFNGDVYIQTLNDAGNVVNSSYRFNRSGSFQSTNVQISDGTGGNVALRDKNNTFTADNIFSGPVQGRLSLQHSGAASGSRNASIITTGGSAYFVLSDDSFNSLTPYALELTHTSDAKIGRDIYEKGRSTPVGHWINFTPAGLAANGGGSIVLNTNYTSNYTLIGKTMILQFYWGVTITGTVSNIQFSIPGGFQSIGFSAGNWSDYTANGLVATNGSSNIFLYKNTAGSGSFTTGADVIGGSISFAIL